MSESQPRKKVTIIIEDEDSISTATFFSVENIDGQMTHRDMSIWEPKLNDPTHINFQRPTTLDVSIRFTAYFDERSGMIREGQVYPK